MHTKHLAHPLPECLDKCSLTSPNLNHYIERLRTWEVWNGKPSVCFWETRRHEYTLIFDLVYSICRKKIETTVFYLNPVVKIELCTCLSFLKPKCSVSFLCLQLSESLIYLICSRSKRLFKNAWHKYVAQVWEVLGWITECSLWLGTAFLIWSDIRWHPWMLFLNH